MRDTAAIGERNTEENIKLFEVEYLKLNIKLIVRSLMISLLFGTSVKSPIPSLFPLAPKLY